MFLSAIVFICTSFPLFNLELVHSAPNTQLGNNDQTPIYFVPRGSSLNERYLDAAPESMSPSNTWPEWLPQDLASLLKVPQTGRYLNGQYNTLVQGQSMSSTSQTSNIPRKSSPTILASLVRQFPKGDPRNCINEGDSINIMQVVPGLGWDNLRNLETGMVTSFSYSQCRVTYDRKYLIPDETFAIPIKSSVVELNSELIDNWDSYKSTTSHSINSGFDFFGKISGKFSKEFLELKSKQYHEKAITMRMELRHQLHTIKQDPGSSLHPRFKTRLLNILSFLKSNNSAAARYAGQLLIRDYGSHYLTSVDSGAVFVKKDNLKSSIISADRTKINKITAAGSANFFIGLSLNTRFTQFSSSQDLNEYKNQQTSSKIITYGGPPYQIGMKMDEWNNGISNNLVAIDRRGKPIHSIINIDNMKPEINDPAEVFILKRLVQDVVKQYYDFNTRLGCTNVNAQNFDYQANSPFPGACNSSSLSFTLGGIFQMCSYISNANGSCIGLIQKNPITGNYSCPSGYESVLLLEGTVSRPKLEKNCKTVKKCGKWWKRSRCRDETRCQHIQKIERAKHQTFWCAPAKKTKQSPTGYLFGGIYSSELNNPITKSKNCPNYFIALKLGANSFICLSENYELGKQFSLPFGGFFSCVSGNKLALVNTTDFLKSSHDWPMRCPIGFTQHLALTENTCRVNFCVKAGALLVVTDPDIILPPFEPIPVLEHNSTAEILEPIDPRIIEEYIQNQTKFVLSQSQENEVEVDVTTVTLTTDNAVQGEVFSTVLITLVIAFSIILL